MSYSIPSSWRSIAGRYRLIGTKCSKEDKVYFPPRFICPDCGEVCEEGVQLSGRGTLVSFTVIHVPPRHHQLHAPYIMGLVKLEEGPVITTQIVGVDVDSVEDLKEGTPMVATFRKYGSEKTDAVIVYGYKFMPAFIYEK